MSSEETEASSSLRKLIMERLAYAVTFLFCAVAGAQAKVYQSIEELPTTTKPFDFIVAGGGTAGSVIASRLSENDRFNVLLVEAGPDNTGVLELIMPGWPGQKNLSKYDWAYTSTPQPGLNGRTLDIPRGHVLGGSSSINGMVYTRGSADDFDNWGRVTGDPGWSWKSLWPYIMRHEKWVQPAGGRDPAGQFDPRVHGYRGKVSVSLPWNDPTDHDNRTAKNAELQKEFPVILDQNAGKPIGITWMQSTIGNGERSSAATAYLGSDVRERPNLTILLNTYITRVLPAKASSRLHDFRSIEIAPRRGGPTRLLTAVNEIIVSGGVIGTPQILLNSGIGNKTELEALGIPPLLNLPDVGQAIIDQATALAMWQENRTGPLTEMFTHQILWSRIQPDSPIFKEFKDPSTGPTSPHVEMPLDSAQSGYLCLLTPHSRGSVKLRSKNPFDVPIIDLGLLTHPFDLAAIKEGIRIVKKFYSSAAWDGFITGFRGPDPATLSNEEFEKIVRDNAITFLHPVGTASMSSKNSKRGVVDHELKLKGATGIRIVDASVFAAVYILAERAADLIREAW
ncbi:hypothetical protein EST38_g3338 [Candolleomyces aberdarensis]|uniref:pyranose dehydrogenase (acceptor) n=1 Tax=Candolleomyces aberdarensis TaxID=2316362 RepID=A0A4Q2DSH1_9AGAR|nr:hypothetical protein EST38_g3338 [Candolleomyces aberdarensis]